MTTVQQKPAAGFTIIEVLIVLAIAGLIFSLVFMALPALQRSGRNNQRKQDVATILQAVARFELNHSANFPTPTDDFLQYSKLTIYDKTSVTPHGRIQGNTSAAPVDVDPISGDSAIDVVDVYNYAKCDPDGSGKALTIGTDYRDIVALYATEGSNDPTPRCQQI